VFSKTAEYAMRAVLVLARHRGDALLGADDIATALGAPRNYMSKTLNALVRQGVLTSARGPSGGFALALPPQVLSVGRVLEVFADQKIESQMCMLGSRPCNDELPCAAHECWTNITVRAREPLMRTTIAELAGIASTQDQEPVADHAGAVTPRVGRNPNPTGLNS